MPNLDYVLVLIQVLLVVACARFAWQGHRAAAEVRELVEVSAALLTELREALAAADSQAAREMTEASAPVSGLDAVPGLARLGMDTTEIARAMRVNRGEAELLVKLGQYRGRHGQG